jgi:hypothetical protein
MTHVTTQLKTLKSPVALYSKSLKCNLGIFLIFFLIRLRYRPFSIGEIVSHVLWPLALEPAPSSTRSCLHIQGEIISHVLKPLKRFDTLFLYRKTERVVKVSVLVWLGWPPPPAAAALVLSETTDAGR